VTVTLESAPPVRLMVHLIEGLAERPDDVAPTAPAISFSGTYGLYRLLSAHAVDGLFGTILPGQTRCRVRPVRIRPGKWIILDESQRTLHILPQERPVMLLRARIELTPAPPVRHYSAVDGTLVSTVQGDDGFARSAMLLSVLREMGNRAAVPAMIALLDRQEGRERWTVMRELLALDAEAAWPHLMRMAADDPDAGVRAAAGAVLSHQAGLSIAEPQPCPA